MQAGAAGDEVARAQNRLADAGYSSAGRGGVVNAVEGLAAARWPPGGAPRHVRRRRLQQGRPTLRRRLRLKRELVQSILGAAMNKSATN